MRSRRLTRLIPALAAAVALALAAIGVLLARIDLGAHRQELEAAASEALGRPVSLTGLMTLSFDPYPVLTAGGLRIANPPWASRPDMVRAGPVAITVEPLSLLLGRLPLLLGRLRVTQLALDPVDVQVETDAEGRVNWHFGAMARGGAPAVLADLGTLEIGESRIAYRNDATGSTPDVDILRGTAARLADGRIGWNLAAAYQSVPLAITATTGGLDGLLGDAITWPVEATVSAAGTTLGLKGAVSRPLGGPTIDLAVQAVGGRLSALDALVGRALPAIGPYEATARVTGDAGRYQATDLQLHVGGSDVPERSRLCSAIRDLGSTPSSLRIGCGGRTWRPSCPPTASPRPAMARSRRRARHPCRVRASRRSTGARPSPSSRWRWGR